MIIVSVIIAAHDYQIRVETCNEIDKFTFAKDAPWIVQVVVILHGFSDVG
jgi:hypothetical protein